MTTTTTARPPPRHREDDRVTLKTKPRRSPTGGAHFCPQTVITDHDAHIIIRDDAQHRVVDARPYC